MSEKEYVQIKMKEIFEATMEDGIPYEGNIETIDYYGMFCKAASKDQLFKLMNNNLCMFKTRFQDSDACLMIYSIPINTSEESGAKSVAERVMDFVANAEKTFVSLDYLTSTEVPEDKFIYIVAIKKINGRD
jgi:hypothetical protein